VVLGTRIISPYYALNYMKHVLGGQGKPQECVVSAMEKLFIAMNTSNIELYNYLVNELEKRFDTLQATEELMKARERLFYSQMGPTFVGLRGLANNIQHLMSIFGHCGNTQAELVHFIKIFMDVERCVFQRTR
jgi:hypothetical protein